jgi:hypothetical protein
MGTGAENARVDWLGCGSFVGVMWCTVRTFGLSFASAGQLGVYYSHRDVNRVFSVFRRHRGARNDSFWHSIKRILEGFRAI